MLLLFLQMRKLRVQSPPCGLGTLSTSERLIASIGRELALQFNENPLVSQTPV